MGSRKKIAEKAEIDRRAQNVNEKTTLRGAGGRWPPIRPQMMRLSFSPSHHLGFLSSRRQRKSLMLAAGTKIQKKRNRKIEKKNSLPTPPRDLPKGGRLKKREREQEHRRGKERGEKRRREGRGKKRGQRLYWICA